MSPSCECDAATHPPRTRGMNAQSPHSFQGSSRSNLLARRFAPRSRAGRRCGRSTCAASPGESGAGVERAVGTDGVRVRLVHVARARCARRRGSGSRGASSPRAGTTSCRRAKLQESQRRAGRRRRPTSCTCRPSGLPPRADRRQRDHALSAAAGAASRMTGLKLTLTSLSAKSCSLQEVEQRRDSCPTELSSKLPPIAIRQRAGDLPDVLDDAVEGALAAAQRPHPVVRVAVAVERDLDAVQPERQQAIDDLRR